MPDSRIILTIKGYSVFLVECSNGGYYSGMCEDLRKKVKEINTCKESYFSIHPELVPVKVVFQEDHLPFREAYAKHRYLRTLTKRHRETLVRTKSWPLGLAFKKIMEKYC
jgi:predicted GIY-YIG superfamily endonuclease